MATLDSTTAAEYAAEVNADDRAQVIIDALTAPVYGRVYNADGTLMGSGTMTSPWAIVSGDKVIAATLSGFFVSVVEIQMTAGISGLSLGQGTSAFRLGLLVAGKRPNGASRLLI